MAGETILIVDDDEELVDVLETVLGSAGYEVRTAPDAARGWEQAQAERPDLAIIDLMMESLSSGAELVRRFREDEGLRRTPIMMLTAVNQRFPLSMDSDEDYLPVDVFVDKPVDPEELLERVAGLLQEGAREG